MPIITLPDGNNLDFPKKVTGLEVAEKISKSLAKQAMVISVDGKLKDLDFVIEKNCSVKIFTSKNAEGLETIRHDTAHILAMAVQELFPGTQVTIGPTIENGFYYDFARKESFTEEDLKKIEEKMREIVDRDEKTKREVWSRDKAITHFKKKGELYKAELIESIPKGEEVSIYFHGGWHDLCRGPHLASTGKIGKAFKLTKVSVLIGEVILTMKCFKEFMEHVGALKKNLMIIYIDLRRQKKEITENLEKKWIYSILGKKVLAQYSGMKKAGYYFKG